MGRGMQCVYIVQSAVVEIAERPFCKEFDE